MCEAYDSYFLELKETNFNKQLDIELWNPYHEVTQLLLFIYTLDDWIQKELSSGSGEEDQAKVDSLGPFAWAFAQIIANASMNRTDIPEMRELFEKTGTKLFSGTALT